MARPRIIKYGSGEVILKNLTKEEADKVQALLEVKTVAPLINKEQALELLNTPSETLTPAAKLELVTNLMEPTESELTHLAVGMHKKTNGSFAIVEVLYNEEGNQAAVKNVREVSPYKSIAAGEFKVLIANKFL